MVTPRGRTYSRATAGDVYGGRFAPSSAAFAAALPALGWSGSASISAPAIPPSTKYRNAQPYLFNSISAPVIPDRLGGPPGYDLDISQLFGPMRTFVDWRTGWRWINDGGDWIDSANTAMGNAPWGSVLTPAAGAAATYAVPVTTALQRVQTTGRWNAWIVRRAPGATAPRTWAGRFHSTPAYRPRIDVTYADSSAATLACRVSAFMGGSTNQPSQGAQTFAMNAAAGVGALALEFDLPTKAVSSATLYFTVTNHWSAACTLEFNLADPPLNTSPVTTGVADAYPLDAGLSAEASIIGVQRYVDGTGILDFWQSTTVQTNHDMDWNFSADVGGTGPNDATMLPRKGAGKFVPNSLYGGGFVSLVDSSYSAESFTPLAAGMGAMRFTMPKAAGIADGFVGGDYGTAVINAYINMPVDKIDVLDRIFVRYYQLIGTTADTGNPYRADIAKKYEVEGSGPSVIKWTDMGGKFSISPCCKTVNGGNSGTSGSGGGWVLRPHFADYWADSVSPGVGGWEMEFEWDDFQNNPSGYNYNVDVAPGFLVNKDFNGWGQRGGLGGVFYAGRWYCIEEELKLNSVATVNAQDGRYWQPDGEVRVWVDGRLVYEVTGVVMRTLPATPSPAGYIQIKPGGSGATQLGIKHLWFNWFHGGTTQNSIDRVAFITGLAWGTSRIGPMKIPSSLPAWVPQPGEMARFTVGGGVLRNNFRSIVAPYSSDFFDVGIVNDFSGACLAPDVGSYGSMRFYGGGHSATNNNQVVDLVFDASGIEFVSLSNPTAWTGSTATDATNRGNNSILDIRPLCDTNWGDAYPLDGSQDPPGIHSFSSNVVIPAANGGAAFGTLFSVAVAGGGAINIPTLGGSHEFAVASMSSPAANAWSRVGSSWFGAGTGWQGPIMAAYVPAQDRVYYDFNASTTVRWYDRATGNHVTGSSIKFTRADGDYNSGQLIHIPSRNLLLFVRREAGYVAISWMDVSVSSPSNGGDATLSISLPVAPFLEGKYWHWAAAAWCPDNNRLILGKILTGPGNTDTGGVWDNAAVYEIEIPATLTAAWPVTRRVTTGVTDCEWETSTWQQPVYVPGIKCWVYLQTVKRADAGNDEILVYRPIGT